jgi:hypothetical protein
VANIEINAIKFSIPEKDHPRLRWNEFLNPSDQLSVEELLEIWEQVKSPEGISEETPKEKNTGDAGSAPGSSSQRGSQGRASAGTGASGNTASMSIALPKTPARRPILGA